ncbi:ubiquitin-associated protein 1-like isoform X2 [Daktulosphaira vitifoliae]|nr:ubiquitin-associated protein 1-like isoform X2 [Daktulosphaira vitifoliae]
MDGIPVKIIEKYKPPKKIALPSVLQHKPSSQALKYEYNFSLEKKVLEKMSIWSKLREDSITKRHVQVEELKKLDSLNLHKLTLIDSSHQNIQVLQPIPAQNNSKVSSNEPIISKNINISDFESDTSSPFDNMELKTINDLEELATVLKPTSIPSTTQYDSSQIKNSIISQYNTKSTFNEHIDDSYIVYQSVNPSTHITQPFHTIPNTMLSNNKNTLSVPFVSMSNVLLELQDDLNSIKDNQELENATSQTPNFMNNSSNSLTSSLPNPYRSLSPTTKSLVDQMNQMGFPLSRAARACKLFGKDESKVIEFLIQIHSLEESSGYPADRIEQALVTNNFNPDNAVSFMKNVDRLIDFGFREENICSALVKCNNDPDKALDSLVSY